MRIPIPPRAERAARKYSVPFLALFHLLVFFLLRSGAQARDFAGKWWALVPAVVAFLLLRDFVSSRRKSRLPDLPAAAAWGTAGLLELHALFPAVAESRIVPFVLFPALSWLLRPLPAALIAAASVPWLSAFAAPTSELDRPLVSLSVMAALGTAAGWAARRAAGAPGSAGGGPGGWRQEGRPLVLPREAPAGDPEEGGDPARSAEQLLRSHERDAEDGIRRVMEGILPTTGADRVMFVKRSDKQGRPFLARHAAHKGGGDGRGDHAIPDSFVPVREAMIFRRAFFAGGEEAAIWGLGAGENRERPSGVAAVPVLHEGREEGALLAFRFGEGEWNEPVIPLLETGAFFVAREIAAARRRYRNDRALAVQAGFHRFVRQIAGLAEKRVADDSWSASPRRELYGATAVEVRARLRADRVLLIEAEEAKPRGRVAWEEPASAVKPGASDVSVEEPWAALDGTYAGWVLERGVHRIFSGAREATARRPVLPRGWARPGECDFLLTPVAGQGGFRGVLVCASGPGRNYLGRDAEEAREFLTIMSMGISHAHHIETLEIRATTDGLTGLLTQKTFRARLSSVLSRLDGRRPCAVVMLDIDHFKRINDTYGHPAGDEVLRRIAGIIGKTVRKADMAGRYGGEEFVLYLDMADRERAERAAERLRLIIGKTRFVFAGREVGITASLGVACYPDDGSTGQELLGRADEALYRSKQGGRNRVSVHRGA
jgi:diguanylate cyclase (GGDEF)-like protein